MREDRKDAFESLLLEVIKQETSALETECGYNEETFISLLSGELALREEEQLRAHLTICPQCALKYASLKKLLRQEEKNLPESVTFSSFVEHVKRRSDQHAQGMWNDWRDTITRWAQGRGKWARIAVAATIIGMVVSASVILPLHYLGKSNVPAIVSDGSMVAKGESSIQSSTSSRVELTPASLVERLDAMAGYEPWRAAAFVIGYLRAAGVPLGSASLAFEHQTTYTTEAGDTWRTVAKKTLGDRNLWPIIVLLNHNRTQHGEFPSAGTILRVPASEDGSK